MQKFRWLSKILPSDRSLRRLVLLTGPRQSGKTTLAQAVYPDLNYVNLDAPENRDAVRSVSTSHWADSIGNAVLDEAQKEPSVFDKVKYAYDARKIRFSVLLGSSQILLLRQVRESLAGRAFLYELWPLMMSELLISATDPAPPEPLLQQILVSKSLDLCLERVPDRLSGEKEQRMVEAQGHLLMWGGMPELLHLADNDRVRWLRSYLYTYLERDLSDLARLPDLEAFKRFQRLCALRSSGLLVYSELAKDAGISLETARRYLEYLKISYQVFTLPPFSTNLTSQVIKSPKLYGIDVGLARQLSGFAGEASGEIYETMVVTEIRKWITTLQTQAEMFFYRTRSGLEVDLLVKTPNGILGAEIKNRREVDLHDCGPLRRIGRELGKRWLGGMCIYAGKSLQRLGEPSLWAMPSWRLLAS